MLRYHYYTIEVPSDCETDPELRFDLAVNEARERANLYIMPCEWRLIRDNGEDVRICRVSRRIK